MLKIIINTDGGARGNPGPAAIGVVIREESEPRKIYRFGELIGNSTNNIAEYKALLLALEKSLGLFSKIDPKILYLDILADSELMVKQIKGEYRVKNQHLKPLFLKAVEQLSRFAGYSITAIPRAKNSEADSIVNSLLDHGTVE